MKKYSDKRTRAEFHEDPSVVRKNAGAFVEMVVTADLLRRGYEVFRSVSAHASCDLVINKAGKLQRVECKTGHIIVGTENAVEFYHPKAAKSLKAMHVGPTEAANYDLIAIYIREENRVIYRVTDQEVSP